MPLRYTKVERMDTSFEVAISWLLSYSYSYSMKWYSYSMRFFRVRVRVLLTRSTSTKNLGKSRIETPRYSNIATSKDTSPRSRRGVVLIAALATLAIVSALIAVGVGMSLRSRQSRKTERDRVQLELLCDAGIRRTAQRLQQDPSYAGEAWLELDGLYPETRMRVLIEPGPSSSTEGNLSPRRTFTIRAILEGRSHSPETMQRSRTHTFFTSSN
jgi:hypothetical protein